MIGDELEDGVAIFLGNKLHTFELFDFELHTWYRLKIIAKGNRFQYFIDDKKMLDFLDDTYTVREEFICRQDGGTVSTSITLRFNMRRLQYSLGGNSRPLGER